MIPKATESVRGSGNIHRDFDVPDADVRQLKAALAAKIIKTLDKKGLSVRKAQSLTGIDAGDFSRVRNADFRRISIERLMAMLNGLGLCVEVAVTLRRAETRHAAAVACTMKSGYESGYKTRRRSDIASSGSGLPAQLLFNVWSRAAEAPAVPRDRMKEGLQVPKKKRFTLPSHSSTFSGA